MDATIGGNIIIQIIIILFLTSINAFFAATEMAFVSVNENRINLLAKKGHKNALVLQKLLKEPSKFLSTIQVGITLAGFFASAVTATSISDDLAQFLRQFNIQNSQRVAVVVITLLLAYVTLVLGELVPKRIALRMPDKLALKTARIMSIISKIVVPFVKLLSLSTNVVMRLLGFKKQKDEDKMTEEEVRSIIEVGHEHGAVNETEHDMIQSVFELNDKEAKEVMTPKEHVTLIDIKTEMKDILEAISLYTYSRIPVFKDNHDNIVGILNVKDIVIFAGKRGNLDKLNINDILRPPLFAKDTEKIDRLFKKMISLKNQITILKDDSNHFSGIITVEDIIEEVTGEIYDEFDKEE